jgi:hypothetical protein
MLFRQGQGFCSLVLHFMLMLPASGVRRTYTIRATLSRCADDAVAATNQQVNSCALPFSHHRTVCLLLLLLPYVPCSLGPRHGQRAWG